MQKLHLIAASRTHKLKILRYILIEKDLTTVSNGHALLQIPTEVLLPSIFNKLPKRSLILGEDWKLLCDKWSKISVDGNNIVVYIKGVGEYIKLYDESDIGKYPTIDHLLKTKINKIDSISYDTVLGAKLAEAIYPKTESQMDLLFRFSNKHAAIKVETPPKLDFDINCIMMPVKYNARKI